ncbi:MULTISPECIES: RNA degradosome polyphosphate kinase [Nocardiopsidaceae]|uniref:Polyphosphate kinase n=2 Tax=Nocardiopsidaceae TaxID=83676 RepID=A0ABY6YKP3_9ACTN|nr:RNA degradosome polyphosphate kinase [Streptomonospora nanhaiensis]MEE2042159.1 RNA degradosome polyphosphate kinase [Nocardiopsis tropica]WAE72808.1 RNA degradosome polyphosphate kinase [Streptomonospora nanhaiensis]
MSTESAPTPAGPTTELPADRFMDREEGWLRFNQRVLELAEDEDIPLLERARFLAIFSSNLDEFFMVRVAGLKRRLATGLAVASSSGHRPRALLERISLFTHELMLRQAACFEDSVAPALRDAGIRIVRWGELDDDEREYLHGYFLRSVYPLVTPFAVDSAHPFPYISGRSLNLAVTVRDPLDERRMFARVKVPSSLPRFIEPGPRPGGRFVPVEDVIAAHLPQLFEGMQILEHHAFRVTRNADLEVDEDETDDLVTSLENELLRRRFGPLVRLEVEETISAEVLSILTEELGAEEEEIYRVPGPLNLAGLAQIADADRPELRFQPMVPVEPRALTMGDLFSTIRGREVLVHHPYESFATTTERFLAMAAADPAVVAIKQTLYRTSGDSPIVEALIEAANAGKEVVVLVEIKARFDEQNNIQWARKLELAGCHVVYGVVGLKTHCKLSMVIRKDDDGLLRRYCHVGTGNYNPSTARIYEDFGLFSSEPEVGEDVSDLFNSLTGFSRKKHYRRLLVAPAALREGLLQQISQEIENSLKGDPARIRIKVNSLVDEEIIDALYRASQAGVGVDLWVRGSCVLRAGVPGLSENIRVRSILGRFLEHSRIFVFANGWRPQVWIGSADLMPRNLDRRVEALVRISDPEQCRRLVGLMDLAMAATTSSWRLEPDGTWTRHTHGEDGLPLVDLQDSLRGDRHLRVVEGG